MKKTTSTPEEKRLIEKIRRRARAQELRRLRRLAKARNIILSVAGENIALYRADTCELMAEYDDSTMAEDLLWDYSTRTRTGPLTCWDKPEDKINAAKPVKVDADAYRLEQAKLLIVDFKAGRL